MTRLLQLLSFLLLVGVPCSRALKWEFGANIARPVQERLTALLTPFAASLPSVTLSLGNATEARRLISPQQLRAAGSEGFVLAGHVARDSAAPEGTEQIVILAANGNGNADTSLPRHTPIGPLYGAYDLLERMGMSFLHPVQPSMPVRAGLRLPEELIPSSSAMSAPSTLQLTSKPRWPIREFHLHTMHPLEHIDLLNGFESPDASFDELLAEFELVCEWLVANRQNRVEWNLLWGRSWDEFAYSPERQQRLRRINSLLHAYGVLAGADIPVALQQQHAMYMVKNPDAGLDQAKADIRLHLDWMIDAGFDFLSTENGFSEFHAPDDRVMLSWLNYTTSYIEQRGYKAYIKVHITTGHIAPNYKDPRTQEPINFNFLPIFAEKELGVMPHTVQVYSVDDPAPTYGNTNFSAMYEFMMWQAQLGEREVVWHPETCYWVNYDLDVPLFLPIYAQRRLHDLRVIAQRETRDNSRIHGQNVFDSGWEWGYWLNSVVAARAAWDPLPAVSEQRAFTTLLAPLARLTHSKELVQLLYDFVDTQSELLVLGRVNGKPPRAIEKRTGVAYLSGWDTWSELMSWFAHATQPVKLTPLQILLQQQQKDRQRQRRALSPAARDSVFVEPPQSQRKNFLLPLNLAATGSDEVSGFSAARGGGFSRDLLERGALHGLRPDAEIDLPDLNTEILPLLSEMSTRFGGWVGKFEALRSAIHPDGAAVFDEVVDGVQVLAHRAAFVHHIYQAAGLSTDVASGEVDERDAQLDLALVQLARAYRAIQRRATKYRIPRARAGAWRYNPTAYMKMFLWTTDSLYFFWRDFAIVANADLETMTPCFMNIINPLDIVFNEGTILDISKWLRRLLLSLPDAGPIVRALAECPAAPDAEPQYPRDLPIAQKWKTRFDELVGGDL